MSAEITASLVEQLIADQFPECAGLPVVPVEVDGWDNTTFRVGGKLSARLPSADAYAAAVEKEQRWLPLLAEQLPLTIPEPVGAGRPVPAFERPWSIYRWIPGRPASLDDIDDHTAFALDLAGFLRALYRIDPDGGPPAGEHNFHRGGPLIVYDDETRASVDRIAGDIDADRALETWGEALDSVWTHPPVWVHGDVAPSNLLVRDGRLAAVIDFGTSAVGDPACDLVIAWTFLSGESRRAFREAMALDDGTWARARGWALWKALITIVRAATPAHAQADAQRFGWSRDANEIIAELVTDRG